MNRHQATMRPAAGRGMHTIGLLTAVLALGALSAPAQVPADAVFSGFKPSGDFYFELGGETLKHAEIFLSDKAAAYLVIAPELASPVLISPRTQSVETVSFMKVAKREDGTIDLLADASFNTLGSFKLQQQEVVFQVKGQTAKLKAKPPLLGTQPAETLRSYKPEYGRNADAYQPIEKAVENLRSQSKDVRVVVYFGTWCPVCGRQVPKILKVADQLGDSRIDFEYYGLPQPMTDDPKTEEDDLHGVPTVIVYVEGKEIGRLTGGDLHTPEKSIYRMING